VSARSPTDPSKLARVYLEHALAGRGTEAAQTLIEALVSQSIDLVDLFERVLTPTAQRVGDLWHAAQISVADEHFVTQLNQKLIAVAGTLRPVPQSRSERVVLACPPDEQHDTGLRMVEQLLIAHGYETSMLGAATPIPALIDYVRTNRPRALGVSVASPLAIASLAATVNGVREAEPGLPIFVGGRCVENYPAVAAIVDARPCTTTRETLEFLEQLRSAATANGS
jgi:MerR family transcriptional regulator, light-induced transcriptional regulator